MSRGIPAAMIQAAEQPTVFPFFAVELNFDTSPLYLWTGLGDLTIDAKTYTGAANLLQISEVQESADISARGATLSLTGIPSSLLNVALAENYQGRKCNIKFGFTAQGSTDENLLLTEAGDEITTEAGDAIDLAYDLSTALFDLFVGYMDQMNIDEGAETASITLTVESRLIDLERPRARRYTNEDQQNEHTADVAFEFVNRLQTEEITWGS